MNAKSLLRIEPLTNWWPGTKKPFLITGPCSAETETQVMETARQLISVAGVHLFRAGLWKPRTRPDSFEGVGEAGLPWMVRIKNELGLHITTEVANARHVELCLKNGFDVLWIGARTTVNPFSVQEIADTLQGVDIPVIVKNPINADLQLWIGALERMARAGITRLVAMHRGFSYHGGTIYRNKPMWEIPIALKTNFPDLEIFCDPSHICGRTDLLLHVAQRALDLGMNGLMLESHIDPGNAWSDAAQQLTPDQLREILSQLNVRNTSVPENFPDDELKRLRKKVDVIDEELVRLIARRMNLAHEIGEYKAEHNMQVLQLERWKEIFETQSALAAELGLSKQFIAKYLEQLHKESIRRQSSVMSSKKIGS